MANSVQLRDTIESDLETFFDQQLDKEANWMAAFTSRNPSDRSAFLAHWLEILSDATKTTQTVLFDDRIAGYVASYRDEEFGKPEVTYWIGKEFWGRGMATEALLKLLGMVRVRPIYARVAKDNLASIRVLQKCNFVRAGEGKGFANARGRETEEFIMKLG